MISAIWIFIKLFMGKVITSVITAITFMVEHWKVFLPLLMVLAAMYLINSAYSERDKAKAELFAYKTEQARLAVQRQIDDAKRDTDAIKLSAENLSKHAAEIARLKLDRDAIKKDLKDEKYYIARVLNANDRLQDDNSGSSRLSEISLSTKESSECGTDCRRTIANLTEAGQSCAIDYNALRQEWDNNCKVYGCR